MNGREKSVKTALACTVAALVEQPAFLRLIPKHFTEICFFNPIIGVIKIIHDDRGIVYLIMCNKLKYNQRILLLLHKTFDSTSIYSEPHPTSNEECNNLTFLYDLGD